MSECFKAFSICLGWGLLAYGNAISHMQLLTPICHVLLAEEAALTFGAREAACIYSLWLLSWARHFLMGRVCRNMSSRLKGWKGLGEKATIEQNLCDYHRGSQVKSQVRQQLSSSFEFLTITSLSLLAPVSWSRCWLLT